MNYKVFNLEIPDGTVMEYITVFIHEDNAKTFPVDENNLDFVKFSEANPDWNKA